MTFGSAMQKMQFEALTEEINAHNALVAKVNAATGDRESLAESIRDSEEFADIRNKIAELEEQLNTAVQVKVEAALADATGDTSELQEQIKDKKGIITSGSTYYKKLYGEDAANELPKVDRVKGQRSGGGGGGGKRIRGYNWVLVVDGGEPNEYENAASAAKALGVIDTAALQEAFFAKAGVERSKDAPNEVNFTVNFTEADAEGNESSHTAQVRVYRTEQVAADEASDSAEGNDSEPEGDVDPLDAV